MRHFDVWLKKNILLLWIPLRFVCKLIMLDLEDLITRANSSKPVHKKHCNFFFLTPQQIWHLHCEIITYFLKHYPHFNKYNDSPSAGVWSSENIYVKSFFFFLPNSRKEKKCQHLQLIKTLLCHLSNYKRQHTKNTLSSDGSSRFNSKECGCGTADGEINVMAEGHHCCESTGPFIKICSRLRKKKNPRWQEVLA